MKKLSTICLALLLMVFTLAGCGAPASQETTEASTNQATTTEAATADAEAAKTPVNVTFLNTKSEIQTQLEDVAKLFNSENPSITLEVLPCPSSTSPFEMVSTRYASGNAPTLSMLDTADVVKFKEKFGDFSSEKWIADSVDGSLEPVSIDGKVIGFPFAIEGYGIIYNKKIVDKAVGGSFDPSTIKTTNDLEDLLKKIEASGTAGIFISPMDWSLGAHLLPVSYIAQGKDSESKEAFITSLKEGKADLINNKVFNGFIATFDVMKKYNIYKNDPLSGTVDTGPQVIGEGEVGLWFMGNWAWTQISEFDPDGEYGFIPVPISNDPADLGNTQLVKWASKYVSVDVEQNTPEQQAAAEKFLEWLVYSESGQDSLVNQCNVIPAFKNISKVPDNPLAKSLKQYIEQGNTMEYIATLPSDHWSEVGASMQKYLSDNIDKEQLAKELEEYWKTAQ